jgi:hypothetical protein
MLKIAFSIEHKVHYNHNTTYHSMSVLIFGLLSEKVMTERGVRGMTNITGMSE